MFYLVDGKFPNGVVTAEVANHDYLLTYMTIEM